MGLDMYLFKEQNEIGYWRKANAIHNWFVQNVQNGIDECQKSKVTVEQLKNFLATVETAIEAYSNGDFVILESILPTTSGFFFGSTNYDEYYLEDLKQTKEILENAIDIGGEFFYQSSW